VGAATVLIGLLLICYLGFLLLTNYWSATSLHQTLEQRQRLESARRVAAVQYFLSERHDDLINLSLSREVSAFFESRALGMSQRYGLEQALVPIENRFRQLIERKRIAGQEIYRRLVLLDEHGSPLVDLGATKQPRVWADFVAPEHRGGQILVLDRGEVLAISLAYDFKGTYSGQLLALFDARLLLSAVVRAGLDADLSGGVQGDGDRTYLVSVGDGQCLGGGDCGQQLPELRRLVREGRLAEGRMLVLGDDLGGDREGSGEPRVAFVRMVPKTGLALIDLMPAERILGRIDPRQLLLGMASLAAAVLFGVFLILRLNVRAASLKTHLRESALRELAVQETNEALKEEIAERLRVEGELRKSKEAAEAASRTKSEFLANMSHEMLTPLNGLVGTAGMLADTRLDGEQRDHLGTVAHLAEALRKVIGDILTYSEIEAGGRRLKTETLGLRTLMEEMADLFARRAEELGLGFACVVERAVPDLLCTDPSCLRQVLIKLIGNALKFTDRGEVEVRVCRVPGLGLGFAVRDTGIGVPEDRLGLLFSPFYQVDATASRRYEGTGLGLATARILVELMGGRIGVESREGVGSRFYFELPETVLAGAGEGADPPPRWGGPPLRVLIADPLAIGRAALAETLAFAGIEPGLAADPAEAMDALLLAEEEGRPYGWVLAASRAADRETERLLNLVRGQPWASPPGVAVLVPQLLRRDGAPAPGWGAALLTLPVHGEDLLKTLAGERPPIQAVPRLPLGPAPARAPLLGLGAGARLSGGGEAQVLLAEDNAINRKVALAQLDKLGYSAEAVENGALAVAAVERGRYGLVLMDIQMPEMDGLEATKRIRDAERAGRVAAPAASPRLPIVAMTAHGLESDRQRCLDAGMDAVVVKPVKPLVLAETLARYLGRGAGPRSALPLG
jgi:signal transduction histidine kinase/CheY-like chemotaxis protein